MCRDLFEMELAGLEPATSCLQIERGNGRLWARAGCLPAARRFRVGGTGFCGHDSGGCGFHVASVSRALA